MQTEIKFAGFGGQGILLSAKLLAYAAMKQGSFVAWIPSYGPEMRGGTAYCTVVISDRLIGSPIIKNPTHLVAMNLPSLEKFENDVKPGGIIFINSSLIPVTSKRTDVTQLVVPVNDIAIKAGSVRAANIVALSAFAAKSELVDLELLKTCVKEEFAAKPKIIPLNMDAFDRGVEIALTDQVQTA
ncbi:MAG: 2-oxoacid:acceptor oxidoreductase family protein [Desulfotignum sp.]|nr:2-oxoacid:acceptor oxidoreductase family protein [Desulfotignum sp.]MCF8124989.1 2-oxoacid:acceptor oxidoreductase family protein [Desulfotignum sp.]